jgi:hypothetical protein
MVFSRLIWLLLLNVIISFSALSANVEAYLPKNTLFNTTIIKPETVLGFGVGERHARHDQLVDYFAQLAKSSNRVQLTNMGLTTEFRKQILVTISSPENLNNLSSILAQRKAHQTEVIKQPNVVWLGYSVHGDEISGANAAMVVAYYLAASEQSEIKAMLADTIIVIEPSINPDGMDRFTTWVNMFRGSSANADPAHIEHHQGWRTGRTNHFGFDLNRDWLLLSQKESQHRLKYYHLYQPNVLSDFHEMGANSTYFFQPGIESRTNPLTPEQNITLTNELAQFHAKALDADNRLYFSQESFDDFYYGKGSTYPDINAAVGILFEQASSRGMQQVTDNGLLTFEFGIQNHVFTSLSTLTGAWQNREKLANYRADFYKQAIKAAKKEDFNGYLIHEADDKTRLNAFLSKLTQHQIKVFPLSADFRLDGKIYTKDNTYYVPLAQSQYRVIKTIFEQVTHFKDNTFYDVSGWTLSLAMNIETQQVGRTWGLKLATQPWQKSNSDWQAPATGQYAYVFEWNDFLAPKLLNKLLNNNIKARVANKPFTSVINGQTQEFKAGSIVIPAGIQTNQAWQSILFKQSQQDNIALYGLSTGLTVKGIDIGSRSLSTLSPVKVLLVGGKGVSQYEAAEVLFYLDDTLQIPVTTVELPRIEQIDLNKYSHILLVDGNYSSFSAKAKANISHWVKNGGVIFGQKRGAKWLAEQDILKVNLVSKQQVDDLFSTEKLAYQDQEQLAARKRIAGAIFNTELDLTHPLAYGFSKPTLPVFRNNTAMFAVSNQPFVSVAKYTESPLLSGYTDKNLINMLANSSALVAHNVGAGRVVATNDVFAFRGYWYGTDKILANVLFFGSSIDVPIKN